MTAQSRPVLGRETAAAGSRLWTVQRGILWSAALDSPPANRVLPRVPVEFRQVHPHDLPQLLAAAAQMDTIPPEALRKRFSLGLQCYTAWVDGSIAAYGWLTRGREWVGEFERALSFQADEAYLWDCATLPAHRRQRLFSALIGHVADQLARQGLQRLWIIAVVTSRAMNRRIADAGFEPIVRLTYLRLYNQRMLLTMAAPQAPWQKILAARRLLKQDSERMIGPLLVGNSRNMPPPDTHLDRR